MKPRLLDLFCGAGGAGMGYYRAGFDVYGIDNNPKPLRHYPFPYICMDALEAMDRLLRGEGLTFSNGETLYLVDFAAIHASPPCQKWQDTNGNGKKDIGHPDYITPVRERLIFTGKPYIIENTHKAPLFAGLMLCGTMFGLRIIRHRYFEASFSLPLSPFTCNHWGRVSTGDFVAAYGRGGKGPRHGKGVREARPITVKISKAEAMGIDWMENDEELNQAIPPAYTEYIGKYLIKALSDGVNRP